MARKRKRSRARSLRRLTDSFEERRFEPAASKRELISVLLLSFGALGVGAGIYAQWFWGAESPPAFAPYLLGAGIVTILVYAFSAPSPVEPLVVGELGLGFANAGKVSRTAWYEVQALTFAHGALLAKTAGKPLLILLKDHPEAARAILAEATDRIPDRVDIDEADAARIGSRSADAGEQTAVDPPQVAGLTCRASGTPLTVEKDVRMCGACGVLYHRKSVPRACAECDRKL